MRTFVTDAGKDSLIYSPDLVPQLAHHADLVASATHDPEPVAGEPRPGRILVSFRPETGWTPAEIRFPFYAGAGHTVTARAPGELLADVADWYAAEE